MNNAGLYSSVNTSDGVYFDSSKSNLVKQRIKELTYVFYDYSKVELKDIRISKLQKRATIPFKYEDIQKFYETNFSNNIIEIVTSKNKYGQYSEFKINMISEIYYILEEFLSDNNYHILDTITGLFCAYLGIIKVEKEYLSDTYFGYDLKKVKDKAKYLIENYVVEYFKPPN